MIMEQMIEPRLRQFKKEFEMENDFRINTDKSLKEQGLGEYLLVSKLWVSKWRSYIQSEFFLHNMRQEYLVESSPPPALNEDIVVTPPQDRVFQYHPQHHRFNTWVRDMINPWDYELFKFLYDQNSQLFKNYPGHPVIRKGLYQDKSKTREIQPNLKKFSVVFIQEGKLVQKVAQVEKIMLVSEWIKLLQRSLEANYNVKATEVKLWLNNEQNSEVFFQRLTNSFKQQTQTEKQSSESFDVIEMQPNQIIKEFDVNDLTEVFIEVSDGKGQFNLKPLEKNSIIQSRVQVLLDKAMKGCGRDLCTFQYCQHNPGARIRKQQDQKQFTQLLVQAATEQKNIKKLVCQKPSVKTLPIQPNDLNDPLQSLKKIIEMLQELESVKTSFWSESLDPSNQSLYFNQSSKLQEDPRVDYDSIEKINQAYQLSPDKEIINQNAREILTKQFPFENEYGQYPVASIKNEWDLRGIYIILLLKFIYQEEVLMSLNGFLNTIRCLSRQQKYILTHWLRSVKDTNMEHFVDQIKQKITISLVTYEEDELACSRAALETSCSFELLEILYNSNKLKKRVPQEYFVIKQAEAFFQDKHKAEFVQFMNYYQRSYRDFKWTFCRWPWCLSTEYKSKILSVESRVEQAHRQRRHLLSSLFQIPDISPFLTFDVRRDDLIQSTLKKLTQPNLKLKLPLKIHFEGEQGVDEGGVKREFFSLLTQQLFSVDYGMFVPRNNYQVLWFNKDSYEAPIQFNLTGILLGLALYNQVLLDIRFPLVVFKKLMEEPVGLEDLKYLDTDVYNSLVSIREEVITEDQCIQFVATYEIWGEIVQHELKPDGQNIFVNEQNKHEYIDLYVDWYLNKSIKRQFDLFYEGFKKVVDGEAIKLFDGEELCQLILGSPEFNIQELIDVTVYENGYSKEHPFIIEFWSIIKEFSLEQQKKFLFFVTGSDRVPIGGLRAMKFIIQKNGNDSELLPTSHTCFNVLLLPQYSSKFKLNDKLLKSLSNAEGFGLF